MAMPSSLNDDETGGGDGVPERQEEPELLLAPGDTDERPPHAPVLDRIHSSSHIYFYSVYL